MHKVLIVDDDINMLKLLKVRVAWEKYGFEIMASAKNGKEALQLMEENKPDLIITDVKMPVMDGLSFCQSVRQTTDDIPIILLSAYEDIETARLAIKYNVIDYMQKPLTPQKIDYLCQILHELACKNKQQQFHASICGDLKRQKEICLHLKEYDMEWFQSFFEIFSNCTSISFQMLQATCFTLIRLFYADGPNSSILIDEQNNALRQCATKLEMVSFVADLYNSKLISVSNSKYSDYQKVIFEQINDYLDKNYMIADCGCSMVSDRFHFSTDHINRLFHRYTGETINVYINRKRLEYSLELLKDPTFSIGKVAESCGFRSNSYFSRFFYKNMGISPTEYRLNILLKSEKI